MVSTWLPSLRSTILLIVVQILLVSNPSQASRSRGYYDDNNNIDNNNNNYNNNDNNYYDSYKPAYTHDDYEPPTEVYMPYHNPTPTSPPWNPTPTSPPWNSPPTSPSWNPTPASPPWKPPTSPPWNPPPNSPPITSPPWNPTPTSPPWNPPPNSPPWNPPTSPPWNPPPTSPPSSTPWNPPPNSPPWNPPTSPPWNPPPTSPPSSPPWNPPSTNPTPTNPPRNPTPTNPPRPPPNKDVQAESSPDKTAFLQGHSRARADVGLPPMIWDDKVAAYAQWWANQRINDCRVVHSDTNYGENIFWGSGGYSAAFAVQSWVNERKHYDYNSNSCRRGMDCGHYTQIVWRKSTRVGCARVRCSNGGVFITCNYDPPGNYVGSRPY